MVEDQIKLCTHKIIEQIPKGIKFYRGSNKTKTKLKIIQIIRVSIKYCIYINKKVMLCVSKTKSMKIIF